MTRGDRLRRTVPLGVWLKTLVLLAVIFGTAIASDRYYRHHNRYIEQVIKRIDGFQRNPEKPLVVGIGASLMMMATPRKWQVEEFDWLRLIIQGSRIEDYAAITDKVVQLQPDLVLIGLNQFASNPKSQQLRDALKRLLRAPLEARGWLPKPATQAEVNRCDTNVRDPQAAVEYVQKQLKSPRNELLSSTLPAEMMQHGIPVRIFRMPMLDKIEKTATNRMTWLENLYREAGQLHIGVVETGWLLGDEYFCTDLYHMNNRGRKAVTAWLKPEILKILGAAE